MTTQIPEEKETPTVKLELLKNSIAARRQAAEVLINRIFIAKDVDELKLMQRWTQMLQQYDAGRDPTKYGIEINNIFRSIREKAEMEIPNN